MCILLACTLYILKQSFTQVEKCKRQQDVPMRLLPGAAGQVADVKCGASFNLALLKVPFLALVLALLSSDIYSLNMKEGKN